MEPEEWGETGPEEMSGLEGLKPYRNQPWSHHVALVAGAAIISFVLFNGVLLALGRWRSVVVLAESTPENIAISSAAFAVTGITLTVYMMIACRYAKGGPVLNIVYSLGIPLVVSVVGSGVIFTEGGWEIAWYGPDMFLEPPQIIAIILVILPWLYHWRWLDKQRSENPERYYEFEECYMPYPRDFERYQSDDSN